MTEIETDDDTELNQILTTESSSSVKGRLRGCSPTNDCADPSGSKEERLAGVCQWTTGDNKRFIPASKTVKRLPPGAYEVKQNPNFGIYIEKIPISIDGLVRFPQANTDRVIGEIQAFWDRDSLFKEFKLTHKRGILMWGPPGGGKSCTIKFVMKDVIEKRKGIVLKFTHPNLFIEGMRIIREIEPHTPVVVLMEDIDATIQMYSESDVLNILDGVDKVEKVVFLATTNYPEVLGARVVNRPSRFDKRFKIRHPNAQSRMIYLKHLLCDDERAEAEGLTSDKKREAYILKKAKDLGIGLEQWVKDTNGFSIAHLKELFVAVCILNDPYEEAIKTLRSMKDVIRSADDDGPRKVGFGQYGDCDDGDDCCVKSM